MVNKPSTVNVVKLNISSIYSEIVGFLDDKGLKSMNTKIAYENDIRQFFKAMRDKDIEHLSMNDLIFKHGEILRYRKFLVDTGYSNSSINRKMACLHKLYSFLERDHAEIREAVFNVDRLKENNESYGVITLDEAQKMIDLVKKQTKGLEKSLLVEMAVKTSIRLNALLELTWDHISQHKDGYWIVTVIDKGEKKDEKPISNDFYQRLLTIKKNTIKYGNNLVFHFDKKTPNNMIHLVCKEMDIPASRNITFHSLKKTAINWTLENGGDIVSAARQGNHASIQTTYAFYLNKNKDFSSMPGLNMDGDLNFTKLNELSKEQIIEIIKQSSYSVKAEIIRNAEKL